MEIYEFLFVSQENRVNKEYNELLLTIIIRNIFMHQKDKNFLESPYFSSVIPSQSIKNFSRLPMGS